MSQLKIYLASPFFNERELAAVSEAERILRSRGYEVYSPREHEYRGAEAGTTEWAEALFREDAAAIGAQDLVVMLYHGNYSDSGTAWEAGYAYGVGKPVVAVILGEDANLMVHRSARACIGPEDLQTYDFAALPARDYTGPML